MFCDIQGVIINHFVPLKTYVTRNYCATVIKSELLSAIKRKRSQFQRSVVLLHHDNAPSDSSLAVFDTVKGLDLKLLPHPPNTCSPDLAIIDFWLFPNFKNRLHGQKYESQEQLRCAVNRRVTCCLDMSRDGQQYVIQSWVERWNKCNLCQGRYFER